MSGKNIKVQTKFLGPLLTTVFLPEVGLCPIQSRLFVLLFGVLL